MTALLDAPQTALRLPYPALADEIARVLCDPTVSVPTRGVQALPGGGSLFLMPALDARSAIVKLISLMPANAGTGRPTIQGDVVVFDVATGERRLVLDGPTVTARRTAAVSLLAARRLAPRIGGPMLIVGAGVQGFAHIEAFAEGLGVREFRIASRSAASAQALARRAEALGLSAHAVPDADAALADCPLVATCTPAGEVVLRSLPREDAFIAAVGAYTPRMSELSPALCRHCLAHGRIVVDTADAGHEAGDLLQAGIDVAALPTLGDVVRAEGHSSSGGGSNANAAPAQEERKGPVLFKSCGWGGWDLAAARLAQSLPD